MEYLQHLRKDKKLAQIITEPLPSLALKTNIPLRLIASIMGQQLSTKVAQVIYNRFLALFHTSEPTPQQVLAIPLETLRSIGLSNAKTHYVQNVSLFCIEHNVSDESLLQMSNEEIIDLLTQIKGVGKWTVEMLLMFTLAREDVFAVDDLGIQQGMTKVYNLNAENKNELKAQMIKRSNKWKPYRTFACLHIWQWKDAK